VSGQRRGGQHGHRRALDLDAAPGVVVVVIDRPEPRRASAGGRQRGARVVVEARGHRDRRRAGQRQRDGGRRVVRQGEAVADQQRGVALGAVVEVDLVPGRERAARLDRPDRGERVVLPARLAGVVVEQISDRDERDPIVERVGRVEAARRDDRAAPGVVSQAHLRPQRHRQPRVGVDDVGVGGRRGPSRRGAGQRRQLVAAAEHRQVGEGRRLHVEERPPARVGPARLEGQPHRERVARPRDLGAEVDRAGRGGGQLIVAHHQRAWDRQQPLADGDRARRAHRAVTGGVDAERHAVEPCAALERPRLQPSHRRGARAAAGRRAGPRRERGPRRIGERRDGRHRTSISDLDRRYARRVSATGAHPLNSLFLRRRRKLVVAAGVDALPLGYVATALKNLERLGYTTSPRLLARLRTLSERDLAAVYGQLVSTLRKLKGADVEWRPMYPNFPRQVMEASDAELYVNALLHYLGDWVGLRILPVYPIADRPPLIEAVELEVIDLGDDGELRAMARDLIGAATSISATDKDDLRALLAHYGADLTDVLPPAIPHKENLAFTAAVLLEHRVASDVLLTRYFRTATDVLRLAVARAGGDVTWPRRPGSAASGGPSAGCWSRSSIGWPRPTRTCGATARRGCASASDCTPAS
jgi:hypothetical protein